MTDARFRPGRRPSDIAPREAPGVADELRGLFLADADGPLAAPLPPLDPELDPSLFVAPPPERSEPFPVEVMGAPEPLPRLGSIIDKYRIEELLGTGGFGAVYRATHLLLERPVAIKLLRSKVLATRPGLAEHLCEEARFAAKISHPNVVQVFDVTHSPRITYVVMEYVEGWTLAQALKRHGRLSPDEVLAIGLDVASGLRAAFERGLIHRDIKPQNIVLAKNGPAKILDLGLALSTTEPPSAPAGASGRASIVGTYGYMAPEQAEHAGQVDFRADIYSLGVTLYEAVTGVPPFPLGDPARCVELHRSAPVPPPEAVVPGLPAPLSYLLRWMLAKEPAKRPPSYAALEEALQKIRAAVAAKVASTRGSGPMSER